MDGLKSIDVRKRAEARNKVLLEETTQERVKYKLATNFKTTFIGSIDIIDKELGIYLWGFGKPYEDLTESERKWLAVREKIREAILDNGNRQLRLAQDTLNKYTLVPRENRFPINKD